MKSTLMSLIAALAAFTGAFAAHGTMYYWDNNGAVEGFGVAGGIWGVDSNWSGDSTGASAPAVTNTTSADLINFGTATHGLASGPIMVNSNNQSFGAMTFGEASGAITLTGGEIQLAAPASSVVINNGTNTINSILAGTNGLNKAGTLSHSSFLTTNSAIIFRNTSLGSVKGADGVMGGASVRGWNPLEAEVFHFVNNNTNATCQLQVYGEPETKCVGIELTQVGSDIAAKVRYAKSREGIELGFDFDTGGTTQSVATAYGDDGYGAAVMMLLTDYGVYEGFLTTQAVTLFPNAQLSNIRDATGKMAGKHIEATTAPGTTFYFDNNGTTATFQLQTYNGGYTKCVKTELTQVGSDIQARAVYAKYYATRDSNVLGIDFDTAAGVNPGTVISSHTAAGYGLTQLHLISASDSSQLKLTGINTYSGPTMAGRGVLEIAEGGQLGGGAYAGDISSAGMLLFNITSDQLLSGDISGIGSLVKTGPFKESVVKTHTSYLPANPDSVIILEDTKLSDCVDVAGILGGSSITDGSGPVPYFFENDGAQATWQLQSILDEPWTKCVKIQLTQVGPDISAKVLYAKHIDNGGVLGYDFDSGGNPSAVATAPDAHDYGVAQTSITIKRHSKLTISGTNTYMGGTVVATGTLEVIGTSASLPTSGGIIVNKDANLLLNVPGDPGIYGSVGGNNPITVNGGVLTINGMFNAGYNRPITINGGVIKSTLLKNSDNSNYMNKLTLMNGAQVTGHKIRVGFISSPTITVSGTNTCSIPAGITMVKYNENPLTLNVADVTGDDAADLTIPGVIRDYALSELENMPMIKSGAGTVSFSGVNTHKGEISINQGVLALDGGNSLNSDNPIVLNGGALNIGDFANSTGPLTVSNTNSLLIVGSGSIAFADSGATTWVNKLTVSGPLQNHSVRFGSNASALSSSQINAIRINGERAALNADGYLTLAPDGTLIIVK